MSLEPFGRGEISRQRAQAHRPADSKQLAESCRQLAAQGLTTRDIARSIGVHEGFVQNALWGRL